MSTIEIRLSALAMAIQSSADNATTQDILDRAAAFQEHLQKVEPRKEAA